MRDIRPINNNGGIQLKFSWGGKRYSLNPIPGGHYSNKRDLATAQAIATKITNDILAGHFDQTLNRYRLAPKASSGKPTALLALWDAWVKSLDLPPQTLANHYRWVRHMIVKTNPGLTDTQWLTSSQIAPKTYNNRLSMLKSCGDWGVSQGWLESNPYTPLKSRKGTPRDIKPFTEEEIMAILEGFDTIAPHYSPFVRFLIATGVRTSEAIGLLWGHIDLTRGEVVIKESLPKDLLGNGYQRVRKATKTGNIRYLYLPKGLQKVLETIRPAQVTPETLVFTTPQGCPIDADNFRSRYWKAILAAQGIPYRKPYTTRHTMISHALEQGTPITGVAYLAGHKDSTMVMKTYGHMVNRPKLPDIL